MWIMWSMGMWHVDCGLRYVDYSMWIRWGVYHMWIMLSTVDRVCGL